MVCMRCREEIPQGEEMNYRGQVLCEDCYVEVVSVPKTCNVAAVYSARQTRKSAGQVGTEGLTTLQKELYEYVKRNGKITPAALAKKFSLSGEEMQTQFAILRHCELLKGTKIDGEVYVVLMDEGA